MNTMQLLQALIELRKALISTGDLTSAYQPAFERVITRVRRRAFNEQCSMAAERDLGGERPWTLHSPCNNAA